MTKDHNTPVNCRNYIHLVFRGRVCVGGGLNLKWHLFHVGDCYFPNCVFLKRGEVGRDIQLSACSIGDGDGSLWSQTLEYRQERLF